MPERTRVLQMGPDPSIGGGMAAALRGLLESPLAQRYELEVVPTYRDPQPLSRLAVFCLALLRLAVWSLRRRGRIVHIHATVRGSSYRKAICALTAKALGRRVILHVHSGPGDIEVFSSGLGTMGRRLLGAGFAAADRILTVSAASAEALAAAYGVSAIQVVPNAAPVVPAFVRPPAGEKVLLAYIGGFANRAKGGDVMLEALKLALEAGAPLQVTMAGPGELPAAGIELLAAYPQVEWAGWLQPGEKDALLRRARLFAMPSRSEGLPMALLEAMAYGLAVAATRVGGIPEVVEAGEDGLLVPPEDPAALADALRRLASDGDLREALADGARRRVERLDAVEVAGRLEALYASLG